MRAILRFSRTTTGLTLGDLTVDLLWIKSDPTTDQRGVLNVGATLEEIGLGQYAYNAPLVVEEGGVSVHVTATAEWADGEFTVPTDEALAATNSMATLLTNTWDRLKYMYSPYFMLSGFESIESVSVTSGDPTFGDKYLSFYGVDLLNIDVTPAALGRWDHVNGLLFPDPLPAPMDTGRVVLLHIEVCPLGAWQDSPTEVAVTVTINRAFGQIALPLVFPPFTRANDAHGFMVREDLSLAVLQGGAWSPVEVGGGGGSLGMPPRMWP